MLIRAFSDFRFIFPPPQTSFAPGKGTSHDNFSLHCEISVSRYCKLSQVKSWP